MPSSRSSRAPEPAPARDCGASRQLARQRGAAWLCTIACLALAGCGGTEDRVASHVEHANALLAEHRGRAALLELRSAANLAPDDADLSLRVADVSLEYGYLGDAVDFYREALFDRPDDDATALKLARLLLSEEPEEAGRLIDGVLKRNPRSNQALLAKAELATMNDETSAAVRYVMQARSIAPDDPEVYWAEARIAEARISAIRARPGTHVHSPRNFQAVLDAYDAYWAKGGERRVLALLSRAGLLSTWPGREGDANKAYAAAVRLATTEGTPHEMVMVARAASSWAARTGDRKLHYSALKRWLDTERENLEVWQQLAELAGARNPEGKTRTYERMIATLPDDAAAHVLYARNLAATKGIVSAIAYLRERMQGEMDGAVILTGIANIQFSEGRPRDAATTVGELQAKYPDRASTALLTAHLHIKAGEFDEAVDLLHSLLERHESVEAHRLLARAEYKRHNYDEALRSVKRAIAIDRGFSPESERLKARIHADSGEPRRAIATLRRLKRTETLTEADSVLLAQLFYDTHGAILGRRVLIELMESGNAGPEVALEYARLDGGVATQREQVRKWLEDSLARYPKNVQLLAALTTHDINDGRSELAIARLNQALVHSPHSAPLYLLLANIELSLGRFKAARDNTERALVVDPTSQNDAIEMLALIYARSPDPQTVIDSLEASLAQEGLPANRIALLARLHLLQDDEERARASYERAYAEGSDLTMLKNDLAYLLARSGRDLDRALQLARQASEAEGEHLNAVDTLGYVYLQSGKYDAALWQFRFVTSKADPPVAEYYYHMALALLKLERNEEAREALDRALAIRPDYHDAASARGSLAPLGQLNKATSDAS